jgi:membrane protease YdiL (CAAX protease family)
VSNCVGAVLLSIIFSWAFMKSKNIFVPILLHMSWNLYNTIFIVI